MSINPRRLSKSNCQFVCKFSNQFILYIVTVDCFNLSLYFHLKGKDVNINHFVVDILRLPDVLKMARYPYVSMGANGQSFCWYLNVNGFDLFGVLENTASLMDRYELLMPQHPLVKKFFGLIKETSLVMKVMNGELRKEPYAILVDELNSFVYGFLDISDTDCHLRKQLSNLSRMSSRNTDSMQTYINNLFNYYSRLLVVRVDFHYRKTEYDGLTLDRVTTDRELFLRIVKLQFTSLVGLCWKLEYGNERSFHYHILFFFNGAEVRQDITLGQQLGAFWLSITQGDGTYFNCNADKFRYEQCYLGQINYYDHQKREALLQANYLTKADENIIAVQLNGKCRIYGRMELPVRTSTAGRPRGYNDVS